jgi:hypothetical protein
MGLYGAPPTMAATEACMEVPEIQSSLKPDGVIVREDGKLLPFVCLLLSAMCCLLSALFYLLLLVCCLLPPAFFLICVYIVTDMQAFLPDGVIVREDRKLLCDVLVYYVLSAIRFACVLY